MCEKITKLTLTGICKRSKGDIFILIAFLGQVIMAIALKKTAHSFIDKDGNKTEFEIERKELK